MFVVIQLGLRAIDVVATAVIAASAIAEFWCTAHLPLAVFGHGGVVVAVELAMRATALVLIKQRPEGEQSLVVALDLLDPGCKCRVE